MEFIWGFIVTLGLGANGIGTIEYSTETLFDCNEARADVVTLLEEKGDEAYEWWQVSDCERLDK